VIRGFHLSETGGHAQNEDAVILSPLPQHARAFLAAVADGQGGQPGGALAARLACETCARVVATFPPKELFLPSCWETILQRADAAVSATPGAGFTTLAAFWLTEKHICGASCGDSAVVLFNAGDPARVLTSGQRKNPPVGSGDAIGVSFAANLSPPWTVLAMSDGVWKYAGWENVLRIGAGERGEAIGGALLDCARLKRTGELQDDFTLIVLQDSLN